MKIKIQYTFALLLAFSHFQSAFAQKKDENIGTEVVNVVKPYTPTISDAFKVKETPTIDDEDNTKKEPIKYSIFSFPVASTFTPSKGKAAGVDKAAEEKLFKDYVTGGVGNYLTAFGELYVTEDLGDNDYAAGMLRHLSSQGGIDGVIPKDSYLNSAIDLTYGSKQKGFSWNADLGFQLQKYHWYGLTDNYGSMFTEDERQSIYHNINNGFTYNDFYVGGKATFGESIFDEMTVKYDRFWNDFKSTENRFVAKPSFHFDLNDKTIKANVIVDYIGGEFAKNYDFTNPLKYGYANFGLQPSFSMHKSDWSFDIGATIFYSLDTANSNNQFLVYPKVNASLKVVGDLMVFYAGADGGLDQNSYHGLSDENPFLSPNVFIRPTDRQFDLSAGLRGKFSNYISYNIKGDLISEKDKALYVNNPFDETILHTDAYRYGNSFGVVYDDVKTISIYGEVRGELSKTFSVGVNGTFSKYDVKFQAEPWNLPTLKFGANLDVNITPKIYAGADVFFVGERKDQFIQTNILPLLPFNNTVTLKSYFDANAHVGYKFNERFSAFLRCNNIANQKYEKWLNYPVQAIQVMGGVNYKFDF